jgi:hypothetical protein
VTFKNPARCEFSGRYGIVHGEDRRDGVKRWLKTCTPLASRLWLLLISGMVWSVVGVGLMITACSWASVASWPENLLWLLSGLGFGVLVYGFGFSRIAERNIRRIEARKDESCLFAFQPWRSYLLIVIMMLLGYGLRHTAIPRPILAAIYAAIGNGLALSSSLYYRKMLSFFTV